MERRNFIKSLGATALLLAAAPTVMAGKRKPECDEQICREAWKKLRKANGAAFDYVQPQKGLANVLIYGDSISIGYTPQVRKLLADQANIFRIHRNGQSSQELIPYLETMQKAMFQPHLKGGWNFEWDLIHFNVGLHDLKYVANGKLDLENGKQVSSIDEYKTNLEKICCYLKDTFPKTKLVFATTTPVPEHAEGRIAGDSVRYNLAAMEVLANHPSIVINDLYAFTKPNFEQWCIKPGNVHYNEQGKSEQAKEVARVIAENLKR